MTQAPKRDHGGGLDAAISRYGGTRADWLDLSTGINPVPYPVGDLPGDALSALPDAEAERTLLAAARRFWQVPASAGILAAPGASSLIAQLPRLAPPGSVRIDPPTYNEHAAAFDANGWRIVEGHSGRTADARVVVHPNNPTGALWDGAGDHRLLIVDESFCDIAPSNSFTARAGGNTLILKSFGKFWGLAGLRLGFLIGDPAPVGRIRGWLGPWPVSGPALAIGAAALSDADWADATRERLAQDADRLDRAMIRAGAQAVGGTPLFRLYRVDDAAAWQDRLAQHKIWSRIFPYSKTWLRLGLPHPDRRDRLEAALGTAGGATSRTRSGTSARPAAR
ncbi:MAG: pyridoxal phosphate-dependent class II aminotransferase [Rhodobacter sp.]|nr:pyridoxal phosphate-dependent class II aminotransferase [Rhodobacter sp.]